MPRGLGVLSRREVGGGLGGVPGAGKKCPWQIALRLGKCPPSVLCVWTSPVTHRGQGQHQVPTTSGQLMEESEAGRAGTVTSCTSKGGATATMLACGC